MPRTWNSQTIYSRAELAAMSPEELATARAEHRRHRLHPSDLPPAMVEQMTAELVEQVGEFEARHQQAS